jgi:hypothetical protein
LFALCVTIQVFLAGLAVFANPRTGKDMKPSSTSSRSYRSSMLALSFFGRLPTNFRWQRRAARADLRHVFHGQFSGDFTVRFAAHPVIAMGLFGMSFAVMFEA